MTNSFNLISASLLKCALRKRIKGHERGEQGDAGKLVSALSRGLNRRSNVLLVCCVASGAEQYEHSVPALKFCHRIRECICKQLAKKRDRVEEEVAEEIGALRDEITNYHFEDLGQPFNEWYHEKSLRVRELIQTLSLHAKRKENLVEGPGLNTKY